MILVTGGAGFIGANFVLDWLATSDEPVINLDKLTYAGNPDNLSSLQGDTRHVFVHGDICDRALVSSLLDKHKPRAIVHFAAESHVDRSIHGPGDFIRTNVDGTFSLLEAARTHLSTLDNAARQLSDFCMSPQTRSSERCRQRIRRFQKLRRTHPIVLTQPRKRLVIIWYVPGTILTDYRSSPVIARIIMARCNSLRS